MPMENLFDFVKKTQEGLGEIFARLDVLCENNTRRVLNAFIENNVQTRHFNPSTGYGYNDEGKEKLCTLFAEIFGAQSALVSPHIVSGTHAIALSLFGVLRPLDTMLSITGRPYDTLCSTIGINDDEGNIGSLSDYAVTYEQIDLLANGEIDLFSLISAINLNEKIKLVYIQRSRGYEWRKSLSVEKIKEVIASVKRARPEIIVMVDNCYGEFCDISEPCHVGADIIAGSLIKNPGGGLAPSGGYIAGKNKYISKIANRLTAPGIGFEVGSNSSGYREYFQGLFLAPHTVVQALKSAVLYSAVFSELGFSCEPGYKEARSCITQAIALKDKNTLLRFLEGIQSSSPVDSSFAPTPANMPGYATEVSMAAGTFISGSSIELSADAPIKPPYIAYLQGGLTFEHSKLALINTLAHMGFNADF